MGKRVYFKVWTYKFELIETLCIQGAAIKTKVEKDQHLRVFQGSQRVR